MKHRHPFSFPGRFFARRGFGPGFGGAPEHDHEHRGPRGRRGMGGFRPERVFDQGELRLVVLKLIAERPRYGYEIIKAIEERLAGSYSPSPGVIYPTLSMLDELGHVKLDDSSGKKLYAITAEGEAYLAENAAIVEAAMSRMDEVGTKLAGGRAPQVMRALHNLKMALRLRHGRGPLDEAQLQKVAEILDAAALAIERS